MRVLEKIKIIFVKRKWQHVSRGRDEAKKSIFYPHILGATQLLSLNESLENLNDMWNFGSRFL